jgi:hypothetical protein
MALVEETKAFDWGENQCRLGRAKYKLRAAIFL